MLKKAGKEKPQKGLQLPKKPAWESWITELEIPMEHTERYIAGSSESSIGYEFYNPMQPLLKYRDEKQKTNHCPRKGFISSF